MNQTEHSISSEESPLGTAPIGQLLKKFAIPSIISMLVGALYNIVDQIFVGNKIGELGNAATNVAFPLVMVVTTLAMTFGAGSSAAFSLYLGQKKGDKAKSIVGNGMTLMLSCSILALLLVSREMGRW